jgi:uncharacterized membrane protein YdjX (TVP38/TMEM64 family)
MQVKIARPLIKLAAAALVIYAAWWIVRCQCINLKSLTPAYIGEYIRSFGRLAALVYILAYVLNTISVVPPIAALSLTAGLAFGALWGAGLLMTAALLGTSMTFMISRLFGRGFVRKILKGRFGYLDARLQEHGFITVLFFRLVPLVPYEVLNYASGLSGIRFRDYFLATFLGLIPGVVIAAFFGGSLGGIRHLKNILAPKFLVAAGLMLALIAIPVIWQVLKRRYQK